MKQFWPWIIFTLVGVWVGFGLFSQLYLRSWSNDGRIWLLFLMSILVAVVWAICFRPQVEKLQISLKAMLVLIAMEAMLLVAYRIAQPFGP